MDGIGRRGSIPLANVFGIRIGVDPSWFFILFLYIWLLSSGYRDTFGPGHDNKAFSLATLSAFLFFASIVLRALIWWRTSDRNRATRVAARAGRGFAMLLGALGFLVIVRGSLLGLWLLAIAWFINGAARAAET